MPRIPFHLSLRADDPFEYAVAMALQQMPKGYAKMFWVRIARLFIENERDPARISKLMFDMATDVRPLRVRVTPRVEKRDGCDDTYPDALLGHAAAPGDKCLPKPAVEQSRPVPPRESITETGFGMLQEV